MRDGDTVDIAAPLYPGGPVQTTSAAHRFDRDVVWLTWDAATRFDVVLRSGALEGGVRLPLGARTSAALGSFVAHGTRMLTFGLTAR